MVNLKSEFSLKEENDLLQYIIKNNKYGNLREEQFWKEVENLDIAKGNWQNLKHYFENNIIYKLKKFQFKLKKEEIDRILKASSSIKKEKETSDNNNDEKNIPLKDTSASLEGSIGKKVIVITRRKNSTNVYPNYQTQGRKRILISRHSNPTSNITFSQPDPQKPRKTIVATLSPGKKKEIFVVRPKEKEQFEPYGTESSKNETENKPPKRLICFSYNAS